MRIFINDYYDTEYDEIGLNDMERMLNQCDSREDVRFYLKHSSDDIGFIEIPFNLGKRIFSLLTIETIATINIYPDTPEPYNYGYLIYIDF